MIKVKELKDDAILNIKVNKSFYLMAKAASFTILQNILRIILRARIVDNAGFLMPHIGINNHELA